MKEANISDMNKSINNIPEIGIGFMGYGIIGPAHLDGYLRMPYIFWPPPGIPKYVSVCDLIESRAKEAAARYKFFDYCTDWKNLIKDDRIQLFINTASSDMHAQPCIEAAKAGKHIICEKPLGRTAEEAKEMLDAVNKAGVKNVCDFIYRLIPALILAKNLIMDGKIGKILHFRSKWLLDFLSDPNTCMSWRLTKKFAGSGAIGNLSHSLDLARWLCGEPVSVMAMTKTFYKERPCPDDLFIGQWFKEGMKHDKELKMQQIDVDDAFMSIFEFENGAMGYIEGSQVCHGHRIDLDVEINGELGSIYWDFGNLNLLKVFFKNEVAENTKGFRTIDVTAPIHPYYDKLLASGEIKIGYKDLFTLLAYNVIKAIAKDSPLYPMIGTFDDGYKATVITDAILKSSETGNKVYIKY